MSEIKVDTLTGKTSAGDITVTSEGGAATQSLQQGLAKCWISYNMVTTTSTYDSLNVSTLTDLGGTGGAAAISVTNAFANSNYALNASTGLINLGPCFINIHTGAAWSNTAPTTTAFRMMTTRYDVAAIVDTAYVTAEVKGDLA